MSDNFDDIQFLLTCGIIMAGVEIAEEEEENEQRFRRSRRHWVSPYLKERNTKGRYMTHFHLRSSPELFMQNFRMSPQTFDELFVLVEPNIRRKRNTRPNDFIPEQAKLAIVLEYMASGDLKRKNEVAEWSSDNLIKAANNFNGKWNFPNCVGAIDGKHICINAPANSGSLFYNYKGFHSIVLLAICDADYKFTYLDVGAYGSEGDSGVFANSKFGASVLNGTCIFPEDADVGGSKLPFFLVGDDAFPLSKRMMKPFSSKQLTKEERIFNYRLSRARRCIENAFGILSARWLCLRKVLFCTPDSAQKMVSACCLLHNFLINKKGELYCSESYSGTEDYNGNWIRGEWEVEQSGETSIKENKLSTNRGRNSDYGKHVRNMLKHFVNSPSGSVPW